MRIRDDDLYCYLGGAVLREAIQDPKVLDGLLDQLEVPGKLATLRALSSKEKLQAIERQIEHFRKMRTSIWFGVPVAEVLAASIYRSRLGNRLVLDDLFADARREEDLLDPVASWLEGQGLIAYSEVPMGRGRVDLIGYGKKGLFRSDRVVAVELKNELDQLKRGLDQMTTFADYAHVVYLAVTPALGAEFLDSHAEGRGVQRWDPDVLNRKLETFGFGLLLVEDQDVNEVVEPQERDVAKDKFGEVVASISEMEPVAQHG